MLPLVLAPLGRNEFSMVLPMDCSVDCELRASTKTNLPDKHKALLDISRNGVALRQRGLATKQETIYRTTHIQTFTCAKRGLRTPTAMPHRSVMQAHPDTQGEALDPDRAREDGERRLQPWCDMMPDPNVPPMYGLGKPQSHAGACSQHWRRETEPSLHGDWRPDAPTLTKRNPHANPS